MYLPGEELERNKSGVDSFEQLMIGRKTLLASLLFGLVLFGGCRQVGHYRPGAPPPRSALRPLPASASPALKQVVANALEQVGVTTGYDPAYVKLDYPNGDVPLDRGVCADVIVRAFRKGGIDLQKEIHEDMQRARSAYSKKWGANAPDSNIDHRRVLNLRSYFERQGKSLPVTSDQKDYLPGDVVTWDLASGLDHTGIVVNMWAEGEQHYLMVHNVGAGAKLEDALFAWKITGHYRYFKSQ